MKIVTNRKAEMDLKMIFMIVTVIAVNLRTSMACITTPAVAPTTASSTSSGTLNKMTEVIFVVDGSASIGEKNFEIVKQWLVHATKTLVDMYGEFISTEVLQYSNKEPVWTGVSVEDTNVFEIPYTLNDNLTLEEMQKKILEMPYLGWETYTHYALRRVMEVEFPRSGYYNESNKIVIVLTDGEAADAIFLQYWYDTYKDVVTPTAIGVGRGVSETDLQKIANGGVSDERVLHVNDFTALENVTNIITSFIKIEVETDATIHTTEPITTMQAPTTVESSTAPATSMDEMTEVIFVVDGSGSIGASNFDIVKRWLVLAIKALVNRFGDNIKTQVLQYSDNELVWTGVSVRDTDVFEIPYTLNDDLTFDEIEDRIMSMPYLESQTYTYYALRRVMEVEFPKSSYYSTSNKIVIVLTDGEASDALFLNGWYQTYKDVMKSFAIGVGVTKGTEFYKQLQKIANGGVSDERVLSIHDFSSLGSVTNEIVPLL